MLPLWKDAECRVRVVRLTEPREVMTLVRLFESVAEEENWQPQGALRHWPDRSVYFGLEVWGHLAGGIQLVQPDPSGTLPCQALWPEAPETALRMWLSLRVPSH